MLVEGKQSPFWEKEPFLQPRSAQRLKEKEKKQNKRKTPIHPTEERELNRSSEVVWA